MKHTNIHNIPVEIIRAIENDSYSKGNADISVTGLIQSPRIRLLHKKHQTELTSDYADEIWKVLGQAVHTILERANQDQEDTITEQRFFYPVNNWVVSGQTDSMSVNENTLKDFKVTSVWSIISALQDGKIDWERQLNCYTWLYHMNTGKKIDQLNIIALARDWNKRELQRRGGDYPSTAISVIKIPLWTTKKQKEYIEQRVSEHQTSNLNFDIDGNLPLCSDEDRWKKKDTYRVLKKGRKTALRVFDSMSEASKYVKGNEASDISIEHSHGEFARCVGNYCGVAEFCTQFNGGKNG